MIVIQMRSIIISNTILGREHFVPVCKSLFLGFFFLAINHFRYVLCFVACMFTRRIKKSADWSFTFLTVSCTCLCWMFWTLGSSSSHFKRHKYMFFIFIGDMPSLAFFTKMYVTNVTVLKRDRGLTEVTTYDILEAYMFPRSHCWVPY